MRIPDCHPDRAHEAKGLCKQCYDIAGRERRKLYARNNQKKISVVRRVHYLKNREKISEQSSQYYLANKERYRFRNKARQARERGAGISDFTIKQWAEMKERYHHCCFYCGIMPEILEQDHIIPLSRGGNHTEPNIVPACRSCNASKHTKTLEEFLDGRFYGQPMQEQESGMRPDAS